MMADPSDASRRDVANHNRSFLPAVDAWTTGLGGVRDVVRQALVAEQLAEWLPARSGARVLDVGCGQGTQALVLARAGFEVTGLDLSADLLALFTATLADEPADVRARVRLVEGAGEDAASLVGTGFDVVLCHGLLMYFADPTALIAAIADVCAPRGRVSFLVRNGLAPAMRPGLLGDYDEALRAFDDLTYTNRLGLAAHMHTPALLDELVSGHALERAAWYGVRVFNDHHSGPAPAGDVLRALIAAEAEAGRREPYRSVSALLHLVYQRTG